MAAAKIAYRRELGPYAQQQAQLQGQAVAVKANQHVDTLRVLNNRTYVTLAVNTGNVVAAAYATLLTANINTILARGFLQITFTASGINTAAATVFFQVLLDGVVVKGVYETVSVAGGSFNMTMLLFVPVRKGAHVVKLQWKTNVNSVHINPQTVNEEHCNLLVQEAL